jgi:DNA-binding response OmpR family regulator
MSGEGIKVLVVEDEAPIRKFITINLKRSGYEVLEADSGEKALEIVRVHNPRIVVLDIMLPGMDGFEVCRRIRQGSPDTVIIMLTARAQDTDKISGLELGADDYMVKPFNPLELMARIKTILRRTGDGKENQVEAVACGELLLDLRTQKFFKRNAEIELTPTEFSILKVFMTSTGKALSRNDLLNTVWGRNYFGDLKTVDVYIRRIREKIEDSPSDPKLIETVWGFGYRWASEG